MAPTRAETFDNKNFQFLLTLDPKVNYQHQYISSITQAHKKKNFLREECHYDIHMYIFLMKPNP